MIFHRHLKLIWEPGRIWEAGEISEELELLLGKQGIEVCSAIKERTPTKKI